MRALKIFAVSLLIGLFLTQSVNALPNKTSDGVCETTATTGTGTVDLAGALDDYLTFITAFSSGATVTYNIISGDGKFETGLGTFTDGTPDTLTRVADWSSDGAGAELNLSGTSTVCAATTTRYLDQLAVESFVIAVTPEVGTITTGTDRVTFRMPYAFTVTAVRCSLNVAQSGGSLFTVDINEDDTSILSTKITIDNSETTSTTAATPPVISDSSIADDAEVEFDIDTVGTGTPAGLKCVLIGRQT